MNYVVLRVAYALLLIPSPPIPRSLPPQDIWDLPEEEQDVHGEDVEGETKFFKDDSYEDITFEHPVGVFIANRNAALIALPSTKLNTYKYIQVGLGRSNGRGKPDSVDSFETTSPIIRYFSQVQDRTPPPLPSRRTRYTSLTR